MKYSFVIAALLGNIQGFEMMLKTGCIQRLELEEKNLYDAAEADAKKASPKRAEADKMTMKFEEALST